jgi:hypothetical protein
MRSFVGQLKLLYDKVRDWVIGLRDRDGCLELYDYVEGSSKTYGSFVTKRCGDKTTALGIYDFIYDSSHLAQVNFSINDSQKQIEYNKFDVPQRIVKGAVSILYEFDASGRAVGRRIARAAEDPDAIEAEVLSRTSAH